MIARLNAAAQLQANVEKTIEVEISKPAYAQLVARAGMAETPDTLPLIKAAKEQLAIRERNFNISWRTDFKELTGLSERIENFFLEHATISQKYEISETIKILQPEKSYILLGILLPKAY